MRPIILLAIIGVSLIAAAVAGRFYFAPTGSSETRELARPSVGGPFTLTDHTGKRVTEKDYLGKHVLIYFGYTFCPDVCPTSLGVMTEAYQQLSPSDQDKVTMIFITVDPARDDVEIMADYVPNFHDDLIGLTGSVAETTAATREFKAYFALVNPEDHPEDYSVDHSSYTYLMGPDGIFIDVFGHGSKPEDILKKLSELL